MQKLGTFNVALTFLGSVLGAGFVSGKELWFYFGSFGVKGLFGLFLSLFLLTLFSTLVLWIAWKDRVTTIDRILYPENAGVFLPKVTGLLFIFFYFCVAVVMIAGIASLGESLLSVPGPLFSAFAVLLLIPLLTRGVAGLNTVFTVSIPILVFTAVVISIRWIFHAGPGEISFSYSASSPLLGNFLVSSINYASLNLFAAVGILAPTAPCLKNKTAVPAGMALGGFLLLVIAFSIVLALCTSPESAADDLPMLFLSGLLGNVPYVLYGILLFLGMFGSAFSTLFAVVEYLKVTVPDLSARSLLLSAALAFSAYVCSLFGFSDLVEVLYPFMGYVGIAAMGLILYRFFEIRRAAAP